MDWIAELERHFPPQIVFTGAEELDAYGYDAWPLAAQWRKQQKRPFGPAAVVRPAHVEEICRLLPWAAARGIGVTPWGAGSSVTGAPLAEDGIALDLARLDRVIEVNEEALTVTVQAGCLGQRLEDDLNARGYTLHHSPQSLNRSTVGGWVATLASGQFSSRWGSIEDMVLALTVVLADGAVVATKSAPRASIGPDLKRVFLGSEGTLGVVVEATLKIMPLPEARRLETVRFASVEAGLRAMRRTARSGLQPFLVRFYDEDESRHVMLDPGFDGCALFFGVEGLAGPAQAEYDAVADICRDEGGVCLGPAAAAAWMGRRFDFSTVENILARPGGYAETIEVAHYWDRIHPLYVALKRRLRPLAREVLGHFSHVYPQGTSLYLILLGEAADDAAAEALLAQVWEESMHCCLEQGAAISHHHGVGLARRDYLRQELGDSFVVLERIKHALDPAGILNPGKLGLGDGT